MLKLKSETLYAATAYCLGRKTQFCVVNCQQALTNCLGAMDLVWRVKTTEMVSQACQDIQLPMREKWLDVLLGSTHSNGPLLAPETVLENAVIYMAFNDFDSHAVFEDVQANFDTLSKRARMVIVHTLCLAGDSRVKKLSITSEEFNSLVQKMTSNGDFEALALLGYVKSASESDY